MVYLLCVYWVNVFWCKKLSQQLAALFSQCCAATLWRNTRGAWGTLASTRFGVLLASLLLLIHTRAPGWQESYNCSFVKLTCEKCDKKGQEVCILPGPRVFYRPSHTLFLFFSHHQPPTNNSRKGSALCLDDGVSLLSVLIRPLIQELGCRLTLSGSGQGDKRRRPALTFVKCPPVLRPVTFVLMWLVTVTLLV